MRSSKSFQILLTIESKFFYLVSAIRFKGFVLLLQEMSRIEALATVM